MGVSTFISNPHFGRFGGIHSGIGSDIEFFFVGVDGIKSYIDARGLQGSR
jgi:hypothetical protein